MNTSRVLLTVAVGVILQMALARYAIADRWVFDLVLVAVVYAALTWGPVAGMWAGTIGGLVQDALSGEVIGVGGLAKTMVGLATGVAGAQFMVTRAPAQVATVAAVTLGHRYVVVSLLGLIDQRWSHPGWIAMLMEIGLNSLAGLLAFQAFGLWRGAMQQTRRFGRSSLSKRRW